MENIIFYTEFDRIIGCTRSNFIKGEPFCDICQENGSQCSFCGQNKTELQQKFMNEKQLKATFVKLYLEKLLRI
ncbi:MAG: hypothetical protein ACTSRS_17965 [Candidatus Helarchaeota archaeon]